MLRKIALDCKVQYEKEKKKDIDFDRYRNENRMVDYCLSFKYAYYV